MDAAIIVRSNEVELDLCLRNGEGDFIIAKLIPLKGNILVKGVEALGLHAIRWVKSLNFFKVIFELDAKSVVDAMKSYFKVHNEFRVIIQKCRRLLNL